MEPHELTVAEASQLIREGKLTPTRLLDSILKRIDALEPTLEAWVTMDRERALSDAEALTREAQEGSIRSPVHGIPVGIKDIYFTQGLRTTMGSPIYADHIPEYDAETVAILRDAGAVIPGKTETTEFAAYDPAPTRNPWNTEHTPGGSSSGSAAAVSSGMCPTALGSQTGGSVIRPAAFCGVVGFKPTYDLISRLGVFPLAWSLDHVGFFTRTVEDATILLNVLSGVEHRPDPEPPKLGLLRGYYEKTADESVWEGLMDAADRLEDGGAEVVELRLPRSFEYVHPAHSIIFATEAASVHEEGFRKNPESYKPKMRSHVAGGLLIPSPAYLRAKRIRGVFAMEARDLLGEADCLLTPSSVTPALRSLKSTGDPAFNAPWSFCGFPSITVPCGLTGDGLPLGLQLTGLPYGEEGLLSAAGWCERILDFPKGPRTP
ncbi:amidase [Candidatus Bathyarchaeota archaeon]|nr:amidase [Candidatus Bathyarchaeota archaeon]